jgi:hypothetical protein
VNKFLNNIIFKIICISYLQTSYADNFEYNSYNNHGVIGLINTPTARFYDEMAHGITFYNGTPDQKITLSSNPFNWLEASFFYTNINDKPYCEVDWDRVCQQSYKDKGFNFKARLKQEGKFPAIAVGVYDMAGTGLYSSEYVVGSYGVNNFDFHFGIGWGNLNDDLNSFKNPLSYLSDNFLDRPSQFADKGGQFQPSRYFSDKTSSPFYGISYVANKKTIFKIERDTIKTPGLVGYKKSSSKFSFALDRVINKNFVLGVSYEKGNHLSLKLIYKSNPKKTIKAYSYEKAKVNEEDNKYIKLLKNLENNGIRVDKITETADSIGLELTQFIHPDLNLIEEIIKTSSTDAGIDKQIKKDLKVANLTAISEIDLDLSDSTKIIYKRQKTSNFSTKTNMQFRPFFASREEFFKGALMLENNSEYVLRDNLFFSTNLKYSLIDNFDDLIYPPVNTFPAQVRSDIKEYLKNMNDGILIGRAQVDYYMTPKKNHHFMLTGGILEDMFNGYGVEYLYFKPNTNYAIGFELFEVRKRDYKWKFGRLDYTNITGSLNFYYRNYGSIPFDMRLSHGEYLAGDFGTTLELSRSFSNGVKFGVFATNTDVTPEQFGEGSFDKGIFFNIPVYGNAISYTWRPLTKDPGARLLRKNTLYDLLVKFRAIN